jgi:hypothetical protein
MALVQATKFRLFCSRNVDGEYKQAEALSFSDGTVSDVDPEVAPDESFLLFSSDGRRTGDTAHEHLYLVHKTGSGWGAVIPLLYPESETGASNDNDARCSRDLKMLYISSDRTLLEHHPMTREETEKALARLEWNNSNTNVWILPASSLFERQKS